MRRFGKKDWLNAGVVAQVTLNGRSVKKRAMISPWCVHFAGCQVLYLHLPAHSSLEAYSYPHLCLGRLRLRGNRLKVIPLLRWWTSDRTLMVSLWLLCSWPCSCEAEKSSRGAESERLFGGSSNQHSFLKNVLSARHCFRHRGSSENSCIPSYGVSILSGGGWGGKGGNWFCRMSWKIYRINIILCFRKTHAAWI